MPKFYKTNVHFGSLTRIRAVPSAHTFACIFLLIYALIRKILIYLQLCWANRISSFFFTDVSCQTYTYVMKCSEILEFVNTEHLPDFSVTYAWNTFFFLEKKSSLALTCSRGTWGAVNMHLHELPASSFTWLPLFCSVKSSIW